jgi:hypothetical protein
MDNESNPNPMWLAREAISKMMTIEEIEADELRVKKRVREIWSSPEIEPGTPERDKLEQEKLSLSLQVGFHENQRRRLKYEGNERCLAGIGSPLYQVIVERLEPALVVELEAAARAKREEARRANFGKSSEDEQGSHARWLVEFAGWLKPPS